MTQRAASASQHQRQQPDRVDTRASSSRSAGRRGPPVTRVSPLEPLHALERATWDRERSHCVTYDAGRPEPQHGPAQPTRLRSIAAERLRRRRGADHGTWTGTLIFEALKQRRQPTFTTSVIAIGGTGALATTTTANGQWQGDIAGFSHFRVRCSAPHGYDGGRNPSGQRRPSGDQRYRPAASRRNEPNRRRQWLPA